MMNPAARVGLYLGTHPEDANALGKGFKDGFVSTINPVNWVKGLWSTIRYPIETGKNIIDSFKNSYYILENGSSQEQFELLGNFIGAEAGAFIVGELSSSIGQYGKNKLTELRTKSTLSNYSTKKSFTPDFYVKPNGDCIPSIGYRYMDSKGAAEALSIGSQYSTYIGFHKFESAKMARESFQVSPVWSDCKVRGQFNTLQAIDDLYIPLEKGNIGPKLEPITKSYPEYGTGGIPQLRVDKVLQFDNVTIIGD